MKEEFIAKAVDKFVRNIVIECFPYDYDASTAEKKEEMKKVVKRELLEFCQSTLARA